MWSWQGWLRVWLTLTLIWVSGWTVATFVHWPSNGTAKVFSLRKNTGELVEFQPDQKQWVSLRSRPDLIVVALFSGAYTVVRKDWSEKKRAEKTAIIRQKLERQKQLQQREQIAIFVSMMAIPPMLLSIGFFLYCIQNEFGYHTTRKKRD